jgi:hypothetical protein
MSDFVMSCYHTHADMQPLVDCYHTHDLLCAAARSLTAHDSRSLQ